jgi:hypothetical protein
MTRPPSTVDEPGPRLPRVMVASPMRYRPECPEVLGAFLAGVKAQEYAGELEQFAVVQEESTNWEGYDGPSIPSLSRPWEVERLFLPAPLDSRYLGGPRTTGETQENIAYLRNRILRRFGESTAALLFMVDSDIVLNPGAVNRMVEVWRMLAASARPSCGGENITLSLQIDNRLHEDDQPVTNARWQDPETGRLVAVPWEAGLREVVEVVYTGACTLMGRAALCRRFGWDPRYNEEHQRWMDDLRAEGFRHWFLREPQWADHRLKREKPARKQIRDARAEWEAKHRQGGEP